MRGSVLWVALFEVRTAAETLRLGGLLVPQASTDICPRSIKVAFNRYNTHHDISVRLATTKVTGSLILN